MMIVFWASAIFAVTGGLALAATFIGTIDDPRPVARHRADSPGPALFAPAGPGDRAPLRAFWVAPTPADDADTLTWLAALDEPERRGDAGAELPPVTTAACNPRVREAAKADSPRAAFPAADDTIADPALGGELWHLVQYALGCDTAEQWVERALAQTGLRREAYAQARRELAAGHG